MSDGFAGWRTLKKTMHFGCMAHARLTFTDVLKGQESKPSPRVDKALKYFQALYQVEALAKGKLADGKTRANETYRLRQQYSVPLLT